MNRPVTTLFMLMSVDGKISTGATDAIRSVEQLSAMGVTKRLQKMAVEQGILLKMKKT